MLTGSFKNGMIVLVVAILVAGVAFLRETRDPGPSQSPTTGAATPIEATTKPNLLPRMIDLGADKCIPCKKMAPILVELRKEYAGKATIEFIDVWKNPEAGKPYEFRVIPTQIFFDRDGKEVWRHEGFLPKDEIITKLKELGAGDA